MAARDGVSGTRLHSWLRRVPMPHQIRCDAKKLVQVGTGKNRWRDVIISIEALAPSLIEAIDADGNVLRATAVEAEEDDDDKKPQEEEKGDPKEHRDVAIARLVLEATDRGSLRNAEAYKLGFDKLASLVEMLLARTTALEGIWQRTLEQRAEQIQKQAAEDGGGDGLEGILKAVLPGIIEHNAANAANAPAPAATKPTNGKAASK